MKLVRVYNLEKFVGNNFKDRKTYDKNVCIMSGENGIVTFNTEGIGATYKDENELIEVYLTDIPEDGIVYIMPQYKVEMTIKELINSAEYDEYELQEYFSRYNYNSRLRSNYHELLEAIKNAGINVKQYLK